MHASGKRRMGFIAALLMIFTPFPPAATTGGERRVAGLNELEVYDPGIREDGVPEIEFKDTMHGTEVEIQPTLHVHRYYYNGDKEYQGPLVNGGPTIVVANHPRTRKRLYIDVNLPSGAPKITYTDDRITYTYPHQRVIIEFKRCDEDEVTVHYRAGRRIGPRLETGKIRNKLHQAMKNVYEGRKKTIVGAAATATKLTGTAIDKVNDALNAIPIFQKLQSAGEQAHEQANLETLRQTGTEQADRATEFVGTNR